MLRELCRVSDGRVVVGQILLLICAFVIGCSEAPPPPPPVVEVSVPVEEPKVIELAKMADVVLSPAGQSELEVRVNRNGNKGSIAVTFQGLPDGVKASVDSLVLKEGASAGKVVLKASPSLGDKIVKTSVSVKAELNNMSASRSLNVVVNKV